MRQRCRAGMHAIAAAPAAWRRRRRGQPPAGPPPTGRCSPLAGRPSGCRPTRPAQTPRAPSSRACRTRGPAAAASCSPQAARSGVAARPSPRREAPPAGQAGRGEPVGPAARPHSAPGVELSCGNASSAMRNARGPRCSPATRRRGRAGRGASLAAAPHLLGHRGVAVGMRAQQLALAQLRICRAGFRWLLCSRSRGAISRLGLCRGWHRLRVGTSSRRSRCTDHRICVGSSGTSSSLGCACWAFEEGIDALLSHDPRAGCAS